MSNVHTAAATLATALESRNRSVEERYQRGDVTYRARVLGADLIVEKATETCWEGVYITDDARDAAAILYGLTYFPA